VRSNGLSLSLILEWSGVVGVDVSKSDNGVTKVEEVTDSSEEGGAECPCPEEEEGAGVKGGIGRSSSSCS
jgi:hypothetical protein